MTRALRTFILLTSTTALLAAPGAFAQQRPAGGRDDVSRGGENMPGSGSEPSAKKREEIRKKIEVLRVWRLTEALKLDPPTAAKLSSLLGSFEEQRKNVMSEQRDAMKGLRMALNKPKPDEAKLKSAIETIEKSRRALEEIREREISGVKNILTVEQQARFLIFQHEFRREMLGMIAGARGGQGRGAGPGGMRGGQTPGNP